MKFKKRMFRFIRKNNEALILLSLILSVLSLVLPFFIEDRLVLYQRIRQIDLPDLKDVTATRTAQVGVSTSVSVKIKRANGTVEYLEGQ